MYYLNSWFKYSLLENSFIAIIPSENRSIKISKNTLSFIKDFLAMEKTEDNLTEEEQDILKKSLDKKIITKEKLISYDLPLVVRKNKLDYLDLRATSRCNLKCIYCSYSNFKNEENKDADMTMETFENVMKNAQETGVATVHFSGGEPFLNPNIKEMLTRARKYFCVSLVCNGILVTPEIAQWLKELKIHVAISLDSIRSDINKKNRTCGTEKVMQGIDHLLAEGHKPDVVCTVTKNNCDYVLELVEHYIDKPVRIGISNLNYSGRAVCLEDELVLTDEEHTTLSKKVQELLEKKKTEKNVVIVDNTKLAEVDYNYRSIMGQLEKNIKDFQAQSIKPKKAAIFNCQAGDFSLSINPNGDISPCSMCKDFVLGNINKDNLLNLWESSEELKFFKYIRQIPTEALEFCNSCEYAPTCNGGCRANAYNRTGSWLAPNPACPIVRKSKRYNKL